MNNKPKKKDVSKIPNLRIGWKNRGFRDKKHDDYIFSGKNSASMWSLISDAKTLLDMKMALYVIGCRCQELEAKVRALSHTLSQKKKIKKTS